MVPINVYNHDLQENHFANTKLDNLTATIDYITLYKTYIGETCYDFVYINCNTYCKMHYTISSSFNNTTHTVVWTFHFCQKRFINIFLIIRSSWE